MPRAWEEDTTFGTAPDEAPEVSVVVPLFNEEENLAELHRRTTAALAELGLTYELVFVNDGSRDATGRLLDELASEDPRLTVLHLSRNFGHQAAVSAGLAHARGDAVVLMDGDLQDPPELIGRFLDAWRDGADVVYAVRATRRENLAKRLAYAAFYRLWRAVSDLDVPLDSGDFCLMGRTVVDAVVSLPERQRFVRGLRAFVGYRQVAIRYDRDARHAGRPKYTLRALTRLAVDGLVGFGGSPMAPMLYGGTLSLLLALAVTGWIALTAIVPGRAPAGWAVTLAAVLYLGAVQTLCLGVAAEYARRAFLESAQRPTYLVARVRRADLTPPATLPLRRLTAS